MARLFWCWKDHCREAIAPGNWSQPVYAAELFVSDSVL